MLYYRKSTLLRIVLLDRSADNKYFIVSHYIFILTCIQQTGLLRFLGSAITSPENRTCKCKRKKCKILKEIHYRREHIDHISFHTILYVKVPL